MAENISEYLQQFAYQVKQAFDRNGLRGVTDSVQENLEEWKSVPLNIAIIGRAGVGKSSFINTFLNLKADDTGAANVDVTRCTTEPKSYFRQDCENVKIWDLPGVGTDDFQRNNYLETINYQRYDFFIILSASRFTEDDIWLAEKINDSKKKYYFVKSKIDVDICSFKMSHRKEVEEITIIDRVKNECKDGLAEHGLPNQNVYVIANYAPHKFEFSLLCATLFNDAPARKREAMAMSFSTLTEDVITKKRDVLKERIFKVAIFSGAAAAVPIPGISITVDVVALIREAGFYRKAFGLDEEGLQSSADMLCVSLEDLKTTLDLKSTAIALTTKGIANYCQHVLISEVVEDFSKYLIPVIGSIIAGTASFWSTRKCLENLLSLMVDDALKIHNRLKRVLESSIE